MSGCVLGDTSLSTAKFILLRERNSDWEEFVLKSVSVANKSKSAPQNAAHLYID